MYCKIMDRRQRKTRQAIFTSFSELLKTNSYENITVQDIIDGADIGRSTFYSHFETKDMLLKAMCSDIFEHIFKGELCDYPGQTHNLQEKLAHILWHLKNHKKDVMGLLSCHSSGLFMGYIEEYVRELFTMHLSELKKDVPEDFLLHHLTKSFCAAIMWCVKNKMDISPEEIAEYFIKLI